MGVLGSIKNKIEQKARPFSREASRSGVVSLEEEGSINREVDTDRLYKLLRRTPEVLSLEQAMVDDIIGNGVTITYLGDSSGERKRKEARRFYEQNVKEEFADVLIDVLNAGDGYLYKDMIDESAARSHFLNNYGPQFNNLENAHAASEALTQEIKDTSDFFEQPRDVEMVPSSTVEHNINEYGDILNYHQQVNDGRQTDIPREKMLHFGYLSLNGGTYNMAPMRTIISEIQTLARLKDHNGKIFDNAAIVNKHFNLPNDGPDSDNYKHLKKTVKTFRNLDKKHRDLITTGDVEVDDLNSIGSEMEFRELAEYLTRVLVMAWGVPPTRVGMTPANGGGARATSLTHQGYFKRIKRLQDKWAEPLNKGLFKKHFNCKISFDDPDVQTEIKEADRDLRETDVALKRMAAGVYDREAAMDYLDVKKEDMADLDDEDDIAVMELAAQIQSGRDQQLDDVSVAGGRPEEQMQGDQEEVQDTE